MAKIKGLCHNYDGCDMAENKVVQEVDETNFICEECGKDLYPVDTSYTNKNKINWLLIGIIAAAVVVLGGVGTAAYLYFGKTAKPKVEKIELKRDNFSLEPREKDSVQVNIIPTNAKATLVWESSDESIVKVDEQGVLTAIADGQTKVKVFVKSNESIYAELSVLVFTPEENPGGDGIIDPPISDPTDLGFATYEGVMKDRKAHGNGTMTFKQRHVIPGALNNVTAEPGDRVEGAWRNGEVNVVTLYKKNGEIIKNIQHK